MILFEVTVCDLRMSTQIKLEVANCDFKNGLGV